MGPNRRQTGCGNALAIGDRKKSTREPQESVKRSREAIPGQQHDQQRLGLDLGLAPCAPASEPKQAATEQCEAARLRDSHGVEGRVSPLLELEALAAIALADKCTSAVDRRNVGGKGCI